MSSRRQATSALVLCPSVLTACASASTKLLVVCGLVRQAMDGKRLPRETPRVLSKVAFQLCIPSFLFSKVASTMSSQSVGDVLLIPLFALFQMAVGLLGGSLGVRALYGTGTETSTDGGMRRLALATSAFGNTLTLPLLFLSSLLGAQGADKAAGFIAMFIMGVSPVLWSLGYALLAKGDGEGAADGGDAPEGGSGTGVVGALRALWRRCANPPLIAICCGIALGCTPLAATLFGPGEAPRFVFLRMVASAVSQLGSATLILQAIVLGGSLANVAALRRQQKADNYDMRPLFISCANRFLLVPLSTLAALAALSKSGLAPADPLVVFVIAVQSCMPCAQNLVLLANLAPDADVVGPAVSRLVLFQYGIALLPVTFWVSLFASMIPGL